MYVPMMKIILGNDIRTPQDVCPERPEYSDSTSVDSKYSRILVATPYGHRWISYLCISPASPHGIAPYCSDPPSDAALCQGDWVDQQHTLRL